MKYLVLDAQYTAAPLRDEFDYPTEAWPIELDPELLGRVIDWNDRYLTMLAADDDSESGRLVRAALNTEGAELAQEISATHAVKVKFSPE